MNNSFDVFDESTFNGRLKIKGWDDDLEQVPTEYIYDCYKAANKIKIRSNDPKPIESINVAHAWRYIRDEVQKEALKKQSKTMDALHAPGAIDYVYEKIDFAKKRETHRKMKEKQDIGWSVKYEKGNYIPQKDECGCNNPMPLYYWYKDGITKCDSCLARELGI